MRLALLVVTVLAAACEVERRDVQPVCVECFSYDGYWAAEARVTTTDSKGLHEEEEGETHIVVDQMRSGAMVFGGAPAQATETGVYFDSEKTFDSFIVGKVTGRFLGESDPDDPYFVSLVVEWNYQGFDEPYYQTVTYEFLLSEKVYE